MEFSDLQKVWDAQNSRSLYTIDEKVLENIAVTRSQHINHYVGIVEWGYMLISLVGSAIILHDGTSAFGYVTVGVLLIIAGFIYVGRQRRLKALTQFDQSVLGKLNSAIQNYRYYERGLQFFPLWYILPIGIPGALNMLTRPVPPPAWKWAFFLLSFAVAYVMIQMTLKYAVRPQLKKLLDLKAKLLEA
ncbi:MAG: hypothetical protein AAF828_01665 [Bacteroidota bacterium]